MAGNVPGDEEELLAGHSALKRRKALAGFLGGMLGFVLGGSLGGFLALTVVLLLAAPWSDPSYSFEGLTPVVIGAVVGAVLGTGAGAWGSLRSFARRR